MRAGERPRFEMAEMGAAAHFTADQTGILQRLDVLGGGLQGDGEGLGELTHRAFAVAQFAQHLAARGVAERMKNCVQLQGLKFNHMVEYKGALPIVNHTVE